MPLQIRKSEICSLQSGDYSIMLRFYAIIDAKHLSNQKGGVRLNRLIDKLAILLLCMMSLAMSDSFIEPVIVAITAVTASAAAQLLTGKAAASVIIAACSRSISAVLLYDSADAVRRALGEKMVAGAACGGSFEEYRRHEDNADSHDLGCHSSQRDNISPCFGT